MKRHQPASRSAYIIYKVEDPHLSKLLADASRHFKEDPNNHSYYKEVITYIDKEEDAAPSSIDQAHAFRRYSSFLQAANRYDHGLHIKNCHQAVSQIDYACQLFHKAYAGEPSEVLYTEYMRALCQQAHLALETKDGPLLEKAVGTMARMVNDFDNTKFKTDYYDFKYQLCICKGDIAEAAAALTAFESIYTERQQSPPVSYYTHKLKLELLRYTEYETQSDAEKLGYIVTLELLFWKVYDAHKAGMTSRYTRNASIPIILQDAGFILQQFPFIRRYQSAQ